MNRIITEFNSIHLTHLPTWSMLSNFSGMLKAMNIAELAGTLGLPKFTRVDDE